MNRKYNRIEFLWETFVCDVGSYGLTLGCISWAKYCLKLLWETTLRKREEVLNCVMIATDSSFIQSTVHSVAYNPT